MAQTPDLLNALKGLYSYCLNEIPGMSEYGTIAPEEMRAARIAIDQAESLVAEMAKSLDWAYKEISQSPKTFKDVDEAKVYFPAMNKMHALIVRAGN